MKFYVVRDFQQTDTVPSETKHGVLQVATIVHVNKLVHLGHLTDACDAKSYSVILPAANNNCGLWEVCLQ